MPDEKTGVAIIKTALQEPLRQIAANAGLDASVIINEILKKGDANYGFDAANEKCRNMMEAKIAIRLRLLEVLFKLSIACCFLGAYNAELVADLPEKEGASPAAPAAGMGEMLKAG